MDCQSFEPPFGSVEPMLCRHEAVFLGAEDFLGQLLVLGLVDLAEQAGQVGRAVHRVEVVVARKHVGVGDEHAVVALGRLLRIEAVGRGHRARPS